MVLASHVIFTAYGFWLPNDPRGSWSDFVRSWELFRFGGATKIEERHSVAHVPHDHGRRMAAKSALRYPPVQFTGKQALTVALGFKTCIERGGLQVWACSILPDHVHMVIARHTCEVEQIVNLLKGEATRRLIATGMHPLQNFNTLDQSIPCCWARRCWKVFLDSIDDIVRAIRYVEDNPLKEGKPRQKWSFVSKFNPATV